MSFSCKASGQLLGPCRGGTPALGQWSPSPAGTQNPEGWRARSRRQRRTVPVLAGLIHIAQRVIQQAQGPCLKHVLEFLKQADKNLVLVWVPAYFIAYGKISQKYLQIHKKYWEIFHHSILIFEGRELCRKLILQGKETRMKCIITITIDSVCIPAASIASTLFLLPLCKGKHLATKLRLTNTWNQYRPNQVYYQYKRIFCQETEAKKPN